MSGRYWFQRGLTAIALALTFLVVPAGTSTPVAHAAATITVNDTSGGHSTTTCTLRDAITAANTDLAIGGCPAGSGADTIVLPAGATIALSVVDNGSDIETNGLPVISSDITINGRGAIIERSSLRGTPAFRILRVQTGGTLTLNNVTIRNGHTPDGTASSPGGYGGGIASIGTLTLRHCTITGNSTGNGAAGSGYNGGIGGGVYNANVLNIMNSTISGNNTGSGYLYGGHGGGIASNGMGIVTITNSTISNNTTGGGTSGDGGWGGGIFNAAEMTIRNSTISGNTTGAGTGSEGGDGGGIYNSYGGLTDSSLSIINSTISGNTTGNGVLSGGFGGGIYIEPVTTATITNSTISGNTTGTPYASGGGVDSSGTLTVTSSTIASNTATGEGGGVYLAGAGTITLQNTIVANNTALSSANCQNAITDGGNNLDSGATCGWGPANGSISNKNPLLGPLANNGGPTQTMALLRGSPAIDGVTFNKPNGSPSTDQRGIARPQGAGYDIGAYEFALTLYLPLILRGY